MILVTGATGNVGHPLVELLNRAEVPVRGVSRTNAGPNIVPADPAKPDTMDAALDGCDTLFLNARAVGLAAPALLERAAKAGVRRVVVLSAINVEDDFTRQPSRFRGDRNREVEQATIESGLDWVSLRPSIFASNTVGLWGAQLRAGDTVFGAYGTAAAAPIDETDIAEVAVVALTGAVDPGTVLELTGPTSLTQREQVAELATALSRPLKFQEIPPATARTAMTAAGFPEAFADAYLSMLEAASTGPAKVTTTVADLLGRPATPFTTWATNHRAAFSNASAETLR